MEIHATNEYAAPAPTVFAMLTDRVFLRAACLATDPLESDTLVDGLRTVTRRVMPTPSIIARLTGPRMTVVDEITWDSASDEQGRGGKAHIWVEGLPAQMLGTVRLRPGGRGSLVDYDGELSVNIPFLGESLAAQAAPLLLEALQIQQRVGDEYLKD